MKAAVIQERSTERAAGDVLARWPWWSVPLTVFLATRVLSGLILVLIGRDQLAFRPLGKGEVIHTWVNPPTYLHLIASWDGQWYQRAAEHGYPTHLPVLHGVVEQNTWAFYPLYPATVRAVMSTGISFGLAASLVSLACGAAAMCLLFRMLVPTSGRFAATLTVLALCVYPATVTFQAAYTESMALLLALVSLWCLRERRYGALLVTALLLSLTRPIVLPIALVAGIHWLARWRRREADPFPRGEAIRLAVAGVVIASSFLLWPAVAALVTGRSDAYFVTANAWYGEDAHGWPSWLVVLAGGGDLGMSVLVGIAAVTLGVLIARPSTRLWGLELRTWAWAYPLYLIGATRPTSSIIRYAMLAAVPWWPFPEVGHKVLSPRGRAGLAAMVLLIGLATQVLWMRWFFVVTPAALRFP